MQRTIKFRAWVVNGGAMASWENITKECDRFSLLKDDNFIFMQFTGLTDKNGVDIYEDDVLRIEYNHLGKVTVKFLGGAYNVARYAIERCAVIGNIHQHPDLLK